MLKHIKHIIRLVTCTTIILTNISTVIHAEETTSNYQEAIVTSTNKLNMRSGPGTSYDIVHQLNPQESVYIMEADSTLEGWTEVSTKDNIKGYVSSKYIREPIITNRDIYNRF